MTDEAKRPMANGMEGWVLVPRNLSKAQVNAAIIAIADAPHESAITSCYSAALAAAPAHPASEAVARLVEALNAAAIQFDAYAEILCKWADESVNGGWSTHQVHANRETARLMRRRAADCRAALAPFLPKEVGD